MNKFIKSIFFVKVSKNKNINELIDKKKKIKIKVLLIKFYLIIVYEKT